MVLRPRHPVSAPPRIEPFEQMLRDGHVFLADDQLRTALGPAFDGRGPIAQGFCVELYRDEGQWFGHAWNGCDHLSIPGSDDAAYADPKKQGSSWLFESDRESVGPWKTFRITQSAGGLSVSRFDAETGSWEAPVEVRPSESPHQRYSRWYDDAVQAFLEQASATEPRLVEKRHGEWEYDHQPLPSPGGYCGIHLWRCRLRKPVLACDRDDGELLVRRVGQIFTFEPVSGELDLALCVSGFSGVLAPSDEITGSASAGR